MVKGLLLIGSGAFLLGASVPLAGALTGALTNGSLIQPRTIEPLLMAYEGSPTVESFPTTVSNELICRSRPNISNALESKADPSDAAALPIRGSVAGVVSAALQPHLLQTFNTAVWPQLH